MVLSIWNLVFGICILVPYLYGHFRGVSRSDYREAEIIPSVPDAAHTAGGKSY
jgi:hypothetical protein